MAFLRIKFKELKFSLRVTAKNKYPTLLVFGSVYFVTPAGTYSPICTGRAALYTDPNPAQFWWIYFLPWA